MDLIVCTLFEDHYHLGLIALANSLYRQGFRGSIYAGYRGQLPKWTSAAKENNSIEWAGSSVLQITDGLQLHFLPLDTEYELTNYKPDFMLRVWNGPGKGAQGIFYFDPDIVVSAPWSFFKEWITYGVALCEDVNSPLPEHHPRRSAWRQYFGDNGIKLNFKSCNYANGGFLGLAKNDVGFLELWQKVQERMADQIGGLGRSIFSKIPLPEQASGPFAPFGKTDQDALNAAIEAWPGKISFIGQEGMAFKPGEAHMAHALGLPKPWHIKHISCALRGIPPRKVDRDYWNMVDGPLRSFPKSLITFRKVNIQIAAFLGRFYKRT